MFSFIPKIEDLEFDDEFDIPEMEPTPVDASQLAADIPEGWVLLGERDGKPHYRTTPGIAVPKPRKNAVLELLADLPREDARHSTGGTCPHCKGSGRYSAHRGHFNNEKCFRCDGKGILDSKDLAYLRRREAADEPVCRVATA
jgi:hypothetical protein